MKVNIKIILKTQHILDYEFIEENRQFIKDNMYLIHTDQTMHIVNMDTVERIIIKRI